MLDDPYEHIADLYDFSYADFDDDVDFYANLAEAVDGPLLELGVGTGRVAIPLAERGYQVVGIDMSEPMLALARSRAAIEAPASELVLLNADMRNFDLGRKFGLVFIAADTFQHLLTTADQLACVRCAARHLVDDGILAFSIRSPATVSWEEAGVPAPLLLDWTRPDGEGGIVMKFVAAHADPERMVRTMTYVYDRVKDGEVKRGVFLADLRYSTQAEIELLLQQANLRVTHIYGDYDLSPVGQGENLVFVARPEEPR
jgi:SAM-dependent methyltransferase